MLLFPRRPDKPKNFENRAKPLRRKLKQTKKWKEKDQPELWKDYKANFSQAQYRKCGYCERKITGETGTVDHFRPKSKVSALDNDPATWGRELPHVPNVRDRKFQDLNHPGYWWLAYEWNNWLLACNRCNTAWKYTLFPVLAPPGHTFSPDEEEKEIPLLLDPYGTEDPAEHLLFGSDGMVEAWNQSRHGAETVRTLGLDRGSLIDARRQIAKRVEYLVSCVPDAEEPVRDEILRDLLERGQKEYEFAGMVRCMVWQCLGLRWNELEEAVAASASS